jgi:hypothetical protein
MSERRWWESLRGEGGELLEKVKGVIREGNVRRIVIKQKKRVVAEFPLTAGVVGAVVAPPLAAIATLIALSQNCTIEVERSDGGPQETRGRSARTKRKK